MGSSAIIKSGSTAIAEWAHDLPAGVRIRLGLGRVIQSESTIRRVLQAIDAEALDAMVSPLAGHPSRPLRLIVWVKVAELDAGVVGGEVPVDLPLVGVGVVLPGGEFSVQGVEFADPAVEALPSQDGQFDLGDVEPGPVFGCVVDLQALGQRERLGGFKGLI